MPLCICLQLRARSSRRADEQHVTVVTPTRPERTGPPVQLRERALAALQDRAKFSFFILQLRSGSALPVFSVVSKRRACALLPGRRGRVVRGPGGGDEPAPAWIESPDSPSRSCLDSCARPDLVGLPGWLLGRWLPGVISRWRRPHIGLWLRQRRRRGWLSQLRRSRLDDDGDHQQLVCCCSQFWSRCLRRRRYSPQPRPQG